MAAGVVLGGLSARLVPDDNRLDSHRRLVLALAALGGAVLGAYGFELPADLLGWHAPAPAGVTGDGMPLGGRTVLGGILGGWIAVESVKPRLNIRRPTGDGFALPLAVALTCGRLGCALTGCCQGVRCAPSALAWRDALGVPRVPVQMIEMVFHAAAAVALFVAARRQLASGRRLAIYVALYGALRFALEFWREHPPIALGLTWYQILAMALTALGGVTWWRRRRIATAAALR